MDGFLVNICSVCHLTVVVCQSLNAQLISPCLVALPSVNGCKALRNCVVSAVTGLPQANGSSLCSVVGQILRRANKRWMERKQWKSCKNKFLLSTMMLALPGEHTRAEEGKVVATHQGGVSSEEEKEQS